MLTKIRINNVLAKLNVDRPDIKALPGCKAIQYRMQDIRNVADVLKELLQNIQEGKVHGID